MILPAVASGQKMVEPPPVRFRMVSLANIINLQHDGASRAEQTYVTPSRFSRWYDAPENKKLLFYSDSSRNEADMAPQRKARLNVDLPGGQGPFLIIVGEAANGSGLVAVPIDHSLEAHKAMSYRVFNFSKRRLAIRLADQDMLLEPGQSGLADYSSERKYWLKIAADEPDGNWVRLYSKPGLARDGTRTTIIIQDMPSSGEGEESTGVLVREMREPIIDGESGLRIE